MFKRRRKNERGLALVELVIVLALTALATSAALVGRGALQRETSFTAAVDQVREQIISVQNESQSGVNIQVGGAGASDLEYFGKMIEFNRANPRQFSSYTLVAENNQANSPLFRCFDQTLQVKDQLEFFGGQDGIGSATQGIIFTRNPEETYVTPEGYNPGPANDPRCASAPGGGGSLDPNGDADGDGVLNGSDDCPFVGKAGEVGVDGCPISVPPDADGDGVSDGTDICPGTPVSQRPVNARGCYDQDGDGLSDDPRDSPIDACPTQAGPIANNGCPIGTKACAKDASYQCGLLGSYYRTKNIDAIGQPARGQYLDKAIGGALGDSNSPGIQQSAYPDFIPTLRARTDQGVAQHASVRWTGQIRLTSPSTQLCFLADDVSRLYIDNTILDVAYTGVLAAPSGTWPEYCGTYNTIIPASGEAWLPFEYRYANTSDYSEYSAFARFYRGSGNSVDFSEDDFRVSKSVSLFDNSTPQGLNGSYYRDNNADPSPSFDIYAGSYLQNSFGNVANGTADSGWYNRLRTRAGAATTDLFGAIWVGYMHLPSTARYRFCTESDDAGYFYHYPQAAHLVLDWPGGHGATLYCSSYKTYFAGQHLLQLATMDTYRTFPNVSSYRILYQIEGQSGPTDIPDNWLSYEDYMVDKTRIFDSSGEGYSDAVYSMRIRQLAFEYSQKVNSLGLNKYLSTPAYAAYQSTPRLANGQANVLTATNYTKQNLSSPYLSDSASEGLQFPFRVVGEDRRANIIVNTQTNTIKRVIQ